MTKNMILVFGASGHSKVVIDLIEKESKYKIFGLIDIEKNFGKDGLGYKVIGNDNDLTKIITRNYIKGGVLAIGDNWKRSQLREKILKDIPNFKFYSCIHPEAYIAKDVEIGDGTVIMAGAIINSSSRISNHCILNTNSSLDHDSYMGDFSSLGPNSTTGGNVRIGSFSAISLGANVLNDIEIGAHSIVGAGSLILNNVSDFSIVYGVPAKFISTREKGEKYLKS